MLSNNFTTPITSYCNSDRDMPYFRRKQTGSFYTDDALSIVMMEELVNALPQEKRIRLFDLRFLEPCVGEGSFVFAYIAASCKLGFSQDQYRSLLDNIYVCDCNDQAKDIYRARLYEMAKRCFDISLDDSYFANHVGGPLLFNLEDDEPKYIPIEDVFGSSVGGGFDLIATNPPYKNLKAERSHYSSRLECDIDKMRYKKINDLASMRLKYSLNGVQNIYKFFVEEIVERYSAKDGVISLLIPSSILTDKTCSQLRKRILNVGAIRSIKIIDENSKVVDAKQAICALLIHKSEKSSIFEICKNYGSTREKTVSVDANKAIDTDFGHSILVLESSDYHKIQKLKSFNLIKDLPFIVNMRGELDLTANKESIVAEDTGFPLLRGRNIGYYQLTNTSLKEYVKQDFVLASSKRCYMQCQRLVCHQIANMSKERRLTYAIAPIGVVLGNSCNFISIQNNKYDIDIYFLLGLLNSSVMNWFFKIYSSNNHINNYEINAFPVPINFERKKMISALVKEYIEDTSRVLLLNEIDDLVNEAFGLNESENIVNDFNFPVTNDFDRRVISAFSEKTERLGRGEILNHSTFKLSELDLEMVRAVPQGGSWKNIPSETVAKSKRLQRITETGGRTTLYGRIDYEKPSYTITTYFSRPGNGTYIHPVHDRVLSVREAARFQTFPESYFFCGNKTQVLKQVGNAVPPLFAYQVAKRLFDVAGCRSAIDLFCGAGGLTLGFKQAGITSVLSTDIESSACLSLKVNNPEIPVLCGDITKADVKERILEVARMGGVDMICGGPPCQGFSLAGHRLSSDPRNQLFKDFVYIVERIKPKFVVFENVEGLLTFQAGEVYRTIHNMFSEIGYNTEGRLMKMQFFAVPQRRKRVFIICVREDQNVQPSELFPLPITDEEGFITARMAIADLEAVLCGDRAQYDPSPCSDFVAMLKGDMAIDRFLKKNMKREVVLSKNQPVQLSLLG